MPSIRVNSDLNNQMHFLTLSIRNWYYIFDRYQRWDIIAKSLKYCQDNKGLKIAAFVFMLNHIHLIVQSEDVMGFIRDFKRQTTKDIKLNLIKTEPNVHKLFLKDNEFSVWQKTNMPKLIETEGYLQQKINYIHQNPVKKNYVILPEHWYWSSANHRCELKCNYLFE